MLCIVEGQCSASPVVWEEETKEELIDSAGRGLRTREERDQWRRGREKHKPLRGGSFKTFSSFVEDKLNFVRESESCQDKREYGSCAQVI